MKRRANKIFTFILIVGMTMGLLTACNNSGENVIRDSQDNQIENDTDKHVEDQVNSTSDSDYPSSENQSEDTNVENADAQSIQSNEEIVLNPNEPHVGYWRSIDGTALEIKSQSYTFYKPFDGKELSTKSYPGAYLFDSGASVEISDMDSGELLFSLCDSYYDYEGNEHACGENNVLLTDKGPLENVPTEFQMYSKQVFIRVNTRSELLPKDYALPDSSVMALFNKMSGTWYAPFTDWDTEGFVSPYEFKFTGVTNYGIIEDGKAEQLKYSSISRKHRILMVNEIRGSDNFSAILLGDDNLYYYLTYYAGEDDNEIRLRSNEWEASAHLHENPPKMTWQEWLDEQNELPMGA